MASITDISYKINNLLYTYYHSEDGIICDEGKGNVDIEACQSLQYDFVDTNQSVNITEVEKEKIRLLNDIMEIFMDFNRYITLYEPIGSGCQTYPCQPGCSCGNWNDTTTTQSTTESTTMESATMESATTESTTIENNNEFVDTITSNMNDMAID